MIIVAMFTLVAALLMIILERIKFIGVIKAQGATNASVRRIFLLLTGKLIIRALLIGNALGIGLALVQQHFHVIRLNPEAYYMPWVPISINLWAIAALNVAVICVANSAVAYNFHHKAHHHVALRVMRALTVGA